MENNKVVDINEIIEGSQPIQNGELEGMNKNDESVTISTNGEDLVNVFNDSIAGYNNINKMADDTENMRKEIYGEINAYSMGLTGKPMSYNKVLNIRDSIKAANKDIASFTNTEIDLLFRGHGVVFNISPDKLVDGVNPEDLKRIFLEVIHTTIETDQIFEQANQERMKINKDFVERCDEILASVDMTEQLNKLVERMASTEDEAEKAKLQEVYMGMYSSISLDLVLSKLDNKPLNIIKKECKKEFDNIEKKARKIIVNDKQNYFLDIKNLRSALYKLYPGMDESVDVLLYIIYKKISKRKSVPVYLVNFLNYFVLSVTKLSNTAFNKDMNIIEYRNKILNILEKLK